MRRNRIALLIILLAVASEAFSQGDLGVGRVFLASFLSGSPFPAAGTQTYVDLSAPASATGRLSQVTFGWSATGCKNVAKILFLRRLGDQLTVIATRGPFDGPESGTSSKIDLTQPVDILQGDLIALVQMNPCGTPAMISNISGLNEQPPSRIFPFEIIGSSSLRNADELGFHLALNGSGTATEAIESVIPVVANQKGAFGTRFVTALQIHNPSSLVKHGRFVFHPAGKLGSPFDPSLEFSLSQGQTVSYPDLLQAIGVTGLGSVDVVTDLARSPASTAPTSSIATTAFDVFQPQLSPTPESQSPPTALVRIETGTTANSGLLSLVEPIVDILTNSLGSAVLRYGELGVLLTPPGFENVRMNIGVRTLFTGATLFVKTLDESGQALSTVERVYPPTWFEQIDAQSFIGRPLPVNGTIAVEVIGGEAIVYASTIDNQSGDSRLQFATFVRAGFP